MQPIILCSGKDGRCVVYGYVEGEPTPGEPVRLHRARMVLRWSKGGLFDLAAQGPPEGSLVTHAVETVVETVWQEWLSVSPAAAEQLDAWEV